ncbi:hypothetical protein C2845_PM05G14520 [Panicum miliaceum]|uniref:Uncharacterized protein n=1 Tax=Panicum miliaceum TaxID=4540 RepID=A0A3L6SX11_PANMI|nr:hypothetical protein C2845_PM05G14520 [Panicum miliaceum]
MERRFQGSRESRENWENRDSRARFGNSGRENVGFQHKEQWESRDNRGEGGFERKSYAGLKRGGEGPEGREVRQMTEDDLRHKLNREQEDKRRFQQSSSQPQF